MTALVFLLPFAGSKDNCFAPEEAHATTDTALSTSEIARKAGPATITVITFDSNGDTLAQGSGFIVKSDGTFVTNWHVMKGASSALIILSSGERFKHVTFLAGDPESDIAVLKFPGYELPKIAATATTPVIGSKVVVIGSPLGLEQTVSEGIVSATRMIDGKEVVQISAPVSQGSSGGPVLDAKGSAFCIATLTLEGGETLNFGVPLRYAMGLLSTSLQEKPLADVFDSNTGFGVEQSDGDKRGWPEEWLPTKNPSKDLSGTYTFFSIAKRVYPSDTAYFENRGVLVLGKTTGLIRYCTSGTDISSNTGYVSPIFDMNFAPDGRFALGLAGWSLDGYEATAGLIMEGQYIGSNFTDIESISAVRYKAKLSDPNGLYSINARLRFQSSFGNDPEAFDWFGEASIFWLRDSITISLYLENSGGGNTSAILQGPISSRGVFDLRNELNDGAYMRLAGNLAAGTISAQWTDMREVNAGFAGTLSGKRQ